MLVLDMIEILPPLGKYKYDSWRLVPVMCYIDYSLHLRSCIRNVNKHFCHHCQGGSQYLLSIYRLQGLILASIISLTDLFAALCLCHTPFRERGNEASIRVPRMFKSHAWQQYDKQMQCY
jgi:hypothetical protein